MNNQCIFCRGSLSLSLPGVYDTRFGIAQPYSIEKCESCLLEQTRPTPTQDELNVLYEHFYNFGGEKNTRYTSLRQKFFNSFVYRIWLGVDGDISFHLMRGTGRLLDVGCNEGRGLEFYKANGFQAEGLELNSHAAAVARSKGFVVHGSTLEDFDQHHQFDFIILSNVLEHSLDPIRMLSAIYRLLKPGGIVCISCPNSQSWLRKTFKKNWVNWHVPFHLTHFSRKTLSDLLSKSNFSVKKSSDSTPALWVAHSIITCSFFVPGKVTSQLRSAPLVAGMILIIRGLFFLFLWLGNILGRGDCLVFVAKKI
jgi:2-polyprenyl-3-methyl-5-hydroxy-6-metoxy-1,4-benzoquinol methylase